MKIRRRRSFIWGLVLVLALSVMASSSAIAAGDQPSGAEPVNLQLIGITDFHGYLQPVNYASSGQINSPSGPLTVGGAAYMATHIKQLRQGHANSLLLSNGDNFSGWPFEVDAFKNEPTIEVLNQIGVDVSAAGNHEFDVSSDFLTKHMQKGICFGTRDVDSCFKDSTGHTFHGSDFEYLGANIYDDKSNRLVLKPYEIRHIPDGHGGTIPVGIIGLNEEGALTKESMSIQAGRTYISPLLEAANRYAKELQEQGVETIIALVHEGGSAYSSSKDFNGCDRPWGPVIDFAKEASSAIDVIITGHWHASFNCSINDPAGNPRPVIEGSNHGRLISEINLAIDPSSKDVIRDWTVSINHPNTRDVQPDPEVERIVAYWAERGVEKWAEPVTRLTGDLKRARNANGESALADVIADAFYEKARTQTPQPADLAITTGLPTRDLLYAKGTNPSDLDGVVTFGEVSEAIGTQNSEVVVTLTGRQIDQILEEQWTVNNGLEVFNPLNVSYNVQITYDSSQVIGDRVDSSRVLIDGKKLNLDQTYRVATTGVVMVNGGGYPSFLGYTNAIRIADWPVLDYLKSKSVLETPVLNRLLPDQP